MGENLRLIEALSFDDEYKKDIYMKFLYGEYLKGFNYGKPLDYESFVEKYNRDNKIAHWL